MLKFSDVTAIVSVTNEFSGLAGHPRQPQPLPTLSPRAGMPQYTASTSLGANSRMSEEGLTALLTKKNYKIVVNTKSSLAEVVC